MTTSPIFRSILLAALVLTAYAPVLHNGFIWDDDSYIEQNVQLRSLHGLGRIWFDPLNAEPQYYPLTHTTLWIEYQLWGARPFGYHLDNLLLHLAGSLLLWRILLMLRIPGAYLVALIFAVHPIQVESVAWATERKNVLSGVFYFLSLWSYLHTRWVFLPRPVLRERLKVPTRSRAGVRVLRERPGSIATPSSPEEQKNSSNGRWYALSLLFFLAALLSKSVTSTLPAVILLLIWWKRDRIRAGDVAPLLPMFLAALAMGCLTGWMEKHVVGAIGPDFDWLTPLDRLCIAGRALWFYLAKLILPLRLTFIYPRWQIDPRDHPWQLLFPLSALLGLLALWLLRRRVGRGPLAASLFFTGTLFPALGFMNVFPMRYSFVADHFQYLACIGPIALAVAVALRFRIAVLFFAVVPALCVLSNLQSRIYFDRATLWRDTLAKNPDSTMAHNNYAVELRNSGDIQAAKSQFRAAMDLNPDAADWVGLGQCFAAQGDYQTARDMYLKALAKTPYSSETVLRRLRAGNEFHLGTAYQALAAHAPNPALAHEYRLQAIDAYQQAIHLFPQYEDPRLNLAGVLIDEGRIPEAIDQCQFILNNDPNDVATLNMLGTACYAQHRLDEAQAQFEKALRLDPQNVNALSTLAAVIAQRGQIDRAIELLNQALTVDPNSPLAHQYLLAILRQKNSPPTTAPAQ
jgi:tetratricopeptide (TPR) repeat protein